MGRGGNADSPVVHEKCKLCSAKASLECVMCVRAGTASCAFCGSACFMRHWTEHRAMPKTPSPPKPRISRPHVDTAHTPPVPDRSSAPHSHVFTTPPPNNSHHSGHSTHSSHQLRCGVQTSTHYGKGAGHFRGSHGRPVEVHGGHHKRS